MKINKIAVYKQKKDGTPYMDNFTKKPQCIASVMFEGEDFFRSGFIKDISLAESWKPGDDIQAVLFEKGEFKNFKLAGKEDLLEQRVKTLEDFIKKVVMLNYLKIQ